MDEEIKKPATLAEWRARPGEFRKVGGKIYYRIEDLIAWEREQSAPPSPPR